MSVMESIKLVARNGAAVREVLERGEVVHLDTASEDITDEFLLFAIESGLLQQWADGFPDPRNWSEVGCEVILGAAVPGGAQVKVRARASRRAVKDPQLDEADAAARAHAVAGQLLDWYNQTVGPGLLASAQTGDGRRIHILDATKIVVELELGTDECSSVVKDEDGQLKRAQWMVKHYQQRPEIEPDYQQLKSGG
jgi:hypothetical protein